MNPIKGKEFEKIILERAEKMERQGVLTLGRYGVQAAMMRGKNGGPPEWVIQKSLPDLEGVICGSGRQIIIEAKVCSQASYPIYGTHKDRPRQIKHMMHRAKAGALCFIMIHFNPRALVNSSFDAETFAIKVEDSHFWRLFENTEIKSVDREMARAYGIVVPWNLWSGRATKLSPDLSVLIETTEFKLE